MPYYVNSSNQLAFLIRVITHRIQMRILIKIMFKVVLSIIAISIIPTTSFALDWPPQLIQIEDSYFRTPQDVIQIELPEGVTDNIYKTLAFELDDIDITAMVIRTGTTSYYKPVQPLRWGKHVFRLVAHEDDGSILEKGYWVFEVRDSAVFQAIDYSLDSNLTVSQRIADKNIGVPEPVSLSSQGTAVLLENMSNEDWDLNGNVNLIYNNESEKTHSYKELDIEEHLITSRNDTAQLSPDHHNIEQNNLVIDNFYRRYLSDSMRIDSVNSTATGFVMRTEEVTGTKKGFGISDPDNAVTGISWENQPFANKPETLYFSGTYLSAKNNSVTESVGAIQTSQKGETWGLVADSTLNNQQLRLRAEYAESVSDVITDNVNDDKGTATSFLVTYRPQMKDARSSFFWDTGVEHSEVSTLFSSLANPKLPGDKNLNRIFLNTNWTNVNAQLLTAKETNNVDDDYAKPQIETLLYQAILNYSPIASPERGSIFYIFGRPSFSLKFNKTEKDQIKQALLSTTDLKVNTGTSAFSAAFSKEKWNWSWLTSRSEQEDKVNSLNSSTTWLHSLNAKIKANNRFDIKPNIVSQKTNFTTDDSNADNMLLSLNLDYLFANDLKGQLYLKHSSTNSDSSVIMQDVELATVGYDVAWNWVSAKNNRPGLDVIFRGIYQDKKDTFVASNNLDSYEISIGITMILPSSTVR